MGGNCVLADTGNGWEEYMIKTVGGARLERIRYIQAMLGELRIMAEAERCDMLTYMIEMSYIECSDIVRGQRPAKVMPSKGSAEQRNAVA